MNQDKVNKLRNQVKDVRIGGKGTARRKRKNIHKTDKGDGKKLQTALKRLAVNSIQGIEEVNMIRNDGTVLHLVNPKVQASPGANTFSISGLAENKNISEIPGIFNQFGMDATSSLQKLVQDMTEAQGKAFTPSDTIDEEDDEVPDLVENFDDPSKDEA